MLYGPITPHRSGFLEVGHGHQIYWEVSGNSDGWPVVVLHGGPGGRCGERSRRWFHPDYFRIVTFDQRGGGRSTSPGAIVHNTTPHLLADLESLRRFLRIERWVVMGFSWGSALAIAYAEAHRTHVDALMLSSVFTARRFELEWLFSREEARASYDRLMHGSPAVQLAAATTWCRREDAVASIAPAAPLPDETVIARARIGAHYFVNHYFLAEGQLLANAYRLRSIPGVIVQGRADLVTPSITACDLHDAWPGSRLALVDEAGHSSTDPALMRALVDAADSLLPVARARLADRGLRPSAPTPPQYAWS
jgi:proline iminopeptidase